MVGGIALSLGLVVGFWLGAFKGQFQPAEKASILLMSLIGLLDDRFHLSPRWKACTGLGLAIVLAWDSAGLLVTNGHAYQFLGGCLPHQLPVFFVLLVLANWSLPQAFNLIDGANGLAAGTGLIVAASLTLAGSPQPLIMAALAAVLILNWPKAHLFLGDCGALTLGLVLAILAEKALVPRDPNLLLWLFAYPLCDVTLVVSIRFLQGRRLGEGDRSHLHHQWVDRWPGMKGWEVPLLWVLAALCGSALYVRGIWRILPFIGLGLLLGQCLLFLVLSRTGFEFRKRHPGQRKRDFRLKQLSFKDGS